MKNCFLLCFFFSLFLAQSHCQSNYKLVGNAKDIAALTNSFGARLALSCAEGLFPDGDWDNAIWYENTKAHSYFSYKTAQIENAKNYTYIIEYESYSDGLEWKFWVKKFETNATAKGKKKSPPFESWEFMTDQNTDSVSIPDEVNYKKG